MIPLDVRIANFIDSVSFVANKKLQCSVWLCGDKSLSSVISLGELYAQFFDDNDIDEFIEKEINSSTLGIEQKEAIVLFRDRLLSFSKAPYKKTTIEGAELLNDPEWDELVDLASSTLCVFNKLIEAPRRP